MRMVLRHVNGAAKVRVRDAENEELIWVCVGSVKILQKVIIVSEPKGMNRLAVELDIGTERKAFELGWNLIGGEAVGSQDFHHVQEKSFGHGESGGVETIKAGDVCRVR